MKSPGAALAAQRRRIPHTCPVCGKTFTAIRTARYCSESCQQKAKRTRAKS
jgi:predicted nucleic acid-binding Zn ribbon protein